MDAKAFLAEFGHIASAPGGVQRLREMIYNLAVTGDLTRQLPDDGDARTLLRRIDERKAELLARKAFKRSPKLENYSPEIPANIKLPPKWCWSRLVDIGEINPKNESPDDCSASFVPMSGIPQLHGGKLIVEIRPWGEIKKGFPHFANGDVVLAKITPCFENGKASVISGLATAVGAGTTELHVVRPLLVEPGYIYVFLRSPYFAVEGERNMTGTAGQKRLPTEYFAIRAFPLPPLAEQMRIVAKVDELMTLCDKLGAQQHERKIFCQVTRNSAFGKLAAARTRKEIHQAWSRIEAHASVLLDTPESIKSYQSAILDLAVAGLLLGPNERADKSGAELLQDIANQRMTWTRDAQDQDLKEALGMHKKLRTQLAEKPEAGLPSHWAWGSLLQISQVVVDCHNKTAPYVPEGIHLVRTTDIRNGKMDLKSTRKISADTYAYWARRLPPRAGDVFFTREAPMGEAAIVPEGDTVCLGQRSMLIRLFPELFNNRFLLYVIYSPSFQARMMEAAIGMTVKHLRVGGVEDLMVPVPPKQEQDRIVAIADALFAHCDRLMAQLASKQTTASNLAKASIEAITGIRTEVNEEMKAPKTELVSRLSLGVSPADKDQAPLAALLMRSKGELAAKALWQISGLEIDAFYRQLKTEMDHGWIVQPELAYVHEVAAD